MELFLTYWLLLAVALGAAVLALHFTYRILGSDFGFEGLTQNVIIVLVVSALQAAIYLGVDHLGLTSTRHTWMAALAASLAVTWFVYKVTHLASIDEFSLFILVATNQAMIFLAWFLLGVFTADV